jgi:hypothetical protein
MIELLTTVLRLTSTGVGENQRAALSRIAYHSKDIRTRSHLAFDRVRPDIMLPLRPVLVSVLHQHAQKEQSRRREPVQKFQASCKADSRHRPRISTFTKVESPRCPKSHNPSCSPRTPFGLSCIRNQTISCSGLLEDLKAVMSDLHQVSRWRNSCPIANGLLKLTGRCFGCFSSNKPSAAKVH